MMTAPKTRDECYIIEGVFPYCDARCKPIVKALHFCTDIYTLICCCGVLDLQNINVQQFRWHRMGICMRVWEPMRLQDDIHLIQSDRLGRSTCQSSITDVSGGVGGKWIQDVESRSTNRFRAFQLSCLISPYCDEFYTSGKKRCFLSMQHYYNTLYLWTSPLL